MKFKLNTDGGKTTWHAGNGTDTHFSSVEKFDTPQKAVSAIRKHIVRGDEKLEKDLVKSLKDHGLDEKGATPKAVKAAPAKSAAKAAPKAGKGAAKPERVTL
jgi:ribosomal protein L12E/L44/L45/RPP1/RPP2